MNWKTKLALLGTTFLTACAAPNMKGVTRASEAEVKQEAAVQRATVQDRTPLRMPVSELTRFKPSERFMAVAKRVLIAAEPECTKDKTVMGVFPVTAGSIDNGAPVVMEDAGTLKAGDRIIAMGNAKTVGGERGALLANTFATKYSQTNPGQPLRFMVQKPDGKVVTENFSPLAACAFPPQMVDNRRWNAYADAKGIYGERQLVVDMPDDAMLSFVLAHEVSHVLNKDTKSKVTNATLGALAGAVLGGAVFGTQGIQAGAKQGAQMAAGAYNVDRERAADDLGLTIHARTGYRLDAAVDVARRMAEIRGKPEAVEYESTHPSTAERGANLKLKAQQLRSNPAPGQ